MLAAAYGQLGKTNEANNSLQAVLNIRPDFAVTIRKDFGLWFEPEYTGRLIEGLKLAGLELD